MIREAVFGELLESIGGDIDNKLRDIAHSTTHSCDDYIYIYTAIHDSMGPRILCTHAVYTTVTHIFRKHHDSKLCNN